MFYVFTTLRDEQILVNLQHVLMLAKTKKGCFLALDNDSTWDIKGDFDTLIEVLLTEIR